MSGLMLVLAACASLSLGRRCDAAQFVEHVIVDVPVQEGTLVMPGMQFTKTWRVTNTGDCLWTSEYALVIVGGDAMGAPEEAALPQEAAPGESVDVSVAMTAPDTAGMQRSEWMLRNAEGELFGVGPEGDDPLRVELEVAELPVGVVYDFTRVHCLAPWHSGLATFLPCDDIPDEESERIGYLRLNADPALEGSTGGNSPVIEVKPNNGGWIAGFFPPIAIQEGDTFVSTVGCMDGNDDCSVLFQLDYELEDGSRGRLGEWPEVFDDAANEFRVDLTELAGQRITLILMVSENGGRSLEAVGFWLDPRIENPEE